MAPGVLLEPYMSQGSQGVTETPIVSKGLMCVWRVYVHFTLIVWTVPATTMNIRAV